MSKGLSIAALVVIALGVVVALTLFIVPEQVTPVEEEQHEQEEILSYSSPEFGVAFDYSNAYRLEERTETYENGPLKVVVLVDKNAVIPDMSEGPTAISLIAAGNAQDLSLEEWVRTKSISNFNLSTDGTLSSTTIAGESALAYRYSGLYENDAVAVEHNGRIYIFSVGWIADDQPIRHDFEHMLQSVKFI